MCIVNTLGCPEGYYSDKLTSAKGDLQAGTDICLPCHTLCSTCIGPGVSSTSCLGCAIAEDENGTCVSSCQPGSGSLLNEK